MSLFRRFGPERWVCKEPFELNEVTEFWPEHIINLPFMWKRSPEGASCSSSPAGGGWKSTLGNDGPGSANIVWGSQKPFCDAASRSAFFLRYLARFSARRISGVLVSIVTSTAPDASTICSNTKKKSPFKRLKCNKVMMLQSLKPTKTKNEKS